MPISRPTSLNGDNHRPAEATLLRHTCKYANRTRIGSCNPPQHHPEGINHSFMHLALLDWFGRFFAGTGMSTRCPSTTPVGLALGPDSPWADWPAPGTLGLSAGKVLTCLIATHACILTPTPSTAESLRCFTGCRTLPYPAELLRLPRLRRCA